MANVDLGITGEVALHQLGRAVDDAIDSIRRRGEDLAEQLRTAAAAAGEIGSVAGADRAVVIDFELGRWQQRLEQVTLDIGGGNRQYVTLSQPLEEPGNYRAIILITRRK